MIRDLGKQQILYIDLGTSRAWVEDVPVEDLSRFLGGRGINAKILYERVNSGIEPLGAGNVLVFGTGTLTGTSAPSTGRMTITSKSPATGHYLKTSVGGHLGAELKYAGYDYVVVSGVSGNPVYLWINEGHVEIRDAQHIWGRGTRETDHMIKEELENENIQTGVIGPAGENKVVFACIMVSIYNSASRGGIGAVMGSKNLKAIAVQGTGGLKPAIGGNFFELSMRTRQELAKDPSAENLYRWGTAGMIPGGNAKGMLASLNFTRSHLEGAEALSGQYLEDEGYLVGRESCFGCSIACHRYVHTKENRYGEVTDSGPELEAACLLGTECGIVDTEALLKANQLCNDFGLDTISTGHCISWAMETYEKGLIEQTDGLDVRFGNCEAQLELIRRIALRESWLGDLLASGVRQAAEKVGRDSWKWAIQARGLEQSMADTRVSKGCALGFAVNPRGVDHLTTMPLAERGLSGKARELIRKITGDEKYAVPTLTEKRAEIIRWHEDCFTVSDSLGFCAFVNSLAYGISPADMTGFFSLALGKEFTEDEIMLAGRRIFNLERAFNIREGLRRQDDVLPWRLMNEPVPEGPQKGHVTDKAQLDRMLDEYYALNGWDLHTGIPKRETFERLGLVELCRDCIDQIPV